MPTLADKHTINFPAPMPERLTNGKRVAIITGNGTEDLEFFYPYYRLIEEGYLVDVITSDGGDFAGKHGIGLDRSINIDAVDPADYALLYLPGGKAPAELRQNALVLDFVRKFAALGRPIAAICHGPQILVSAGLVQGRTLSAFKEVGKEIEAAGGTYADEALKIDGQFITARLPGDLHRHLRGVLNVLQGRDESPTHLAA